VLPEKLAISNTSATSDQQDRESITPTTSSTTKISMATMSEQQQQQQKEYHASLLGLPIELRRQIYDDAFLAEINWPVLKGYSHYHHHGSGYQPMPIYTGHGHDVPWLKLVATCRTLRDEVKEHMTSRLRQAEKERVEAAQATVAKKVDAGKEDEEGGEAGQSSANINMTRTIISLSTKHPKTSELSPGAPYPAHRAQSARSSSTSLWPPHRGHSTWLSGAVAVPLRSWPAYTKP
jgi:hypothetical protein